MCFNYHDRVSLCIRKMAMSLRLEVKQRPTMALLLLFQLATSNRLGGFQESVSATRYCRQCMVDSLSARYDHFLHSSALTCIDTACFVCV